MGAGGAAGSTGPAAEVVDAAMRELVVRTGQGALTIGAALEATAALRAAADQKLFDLVALAREAGASWSAIGEALGVTTQAAHQRYGRASAPSSTGPSRTASGS